MGTKKQYKFEEKQSVLGYEPIVYGGRIFPVAVDIINEEFKNDPVQLAAFYQLQKNGSHYNVKNPLAQLMFLIYNDEESFYYQFNGTIKEDLENKVYDLYFYHTVEETNDFLFAEINQDMEKEDVAQAKETIASEILNAIDNDELRDILIKELLYSAMMFHYDWPRQ